MKKLSVLLFMAFVVTLSLDAVSFIAANSTIPNYESTGMDILREISTLLQDDDSEGEIAWDTLRVNIARELRFTVRIDNFTIGTRTTRANTSVRQALHHIQNEKNIALIYGGNYDRLIFNGETLNLRTFRSRLERSTVTLYYETYENLTNYVREGLSFIRRAGINGEKEVITKITYIGGVKQICEIVETHVAVDPVNAIHDIGTGQLGALADVTAPDFHYIRRVRMEATAYTAGFSCTGRRPGDRGYRITASGREVEHGIVAVDRTVIPLGTHLYVEGHGFALAADVGGAIRGYKIDLFMECIRDARQFGRRHLYVWILE